MMMSCGRLRERLPRDLAAHLFVSRQKERLLEPPPERAWVDLRFGGGTFHRGLGQQKLNHPLLDGRKSDIWRHSTSLLLSASCLPRGVQRQGWLVPAWVAWRAADPTAAFVRAPIGPLRDRYRAARAP